MQKGIARVVLYLLLIVPLVVVSTLIIKQIQFALDLRRDMIEGTRFKMSFADMQQIMASNELATRSFFLSFFCFLMILCGLLIILKATENAFVNSKEAKVKYSLRTAYPGVVIAVFGCVFLAFSIYSSSESHFLTTRELVTVQTTDSIGRHSQNVTTDDIVYQAIADTTRDLAAERLSAISEPLKEEGVETTLTEKSKPARSQQSLVEEAEPPMQVITMPTDADISWANNLALRSVVFNYYPTASDKARYTSIRRYLEYSQEPDTGWDRDLHWAFGLLQRTQKGYSPSDGELKRFESVIGTRIAGGRQTSAKDNHIVSF